MSHRRDRDPLRGWRERKTLPAKELGAEADLDRLAGETAREGAVLLHSNA